MLNNYNQAMIPIIMKFLKCLVLSIILLVQDFILHFIKN